MLDDHILKILERRGINRDCILYWEELRQVYHRQYHSTKEETRNVDCAHLDAAEAVIEYLKKRRSGV